MTIIAWDGKTLAADKRAVSANRPVVTTKIFRVRDDLVGFSGEAALGLAMVEWYRQGAEPCNLPEFQKADADSVGFVVVKADGRVFRFERSAYPFQILEPFFAMGSGRDYALAAMHLNRTAVEAVELACLFDVNCGNGFDTLMLEGE